MRRSTPDSANPQGSQQRMVRRIPVDFRAVAEEAGMTRGKLCCSTWAGWCVQNTTQNPAWPDMATITPPEMLPGEVRLAVVDGHWCFYAPNDGSQRLAP